MDHDEYVAARRGRLLEHAVELGVAEELAAEHVDRVLEAQRRHIARADDPDPGVRAALAREVTGETGRPGRGRAWALTALALALAAAAVAWSRPDASPTVPSLFGYDVATATRVLDAAGFEVATEGVPACEPRGLVLSSAPAPGDEAERGETVTLRTAAPADAGCLTTYGVRSDAWEFIGFARGGRAPAFARTVRVYLDGDLVAALGSGAASQQGSWSEALALVEEQAGVVAASFSAMPRLVVDHDPAPASRCGVPAPTSYAGRVALHLEIDPSADGARALCPFTIDLYRDAGSRIEAVAVYTGAGREADAVS